jgi:hypothetical protein
MHPWAMLAAVGGASGGFIVGGLTATVALVVILVRRGVLPRGNGLGRLVLGGVLIGLGVVLSDSGVVLSAVNGAGQESGVTFHVPDGLVLTLDWAAIPCGLAGLALLAAAFLRRQRSRQAGPEPAKPPEATKAPEAAQSKEEAKAAEPRKNPGQSSTAPPRSPSPPA